MKEALNVSKEKITELSFRDESAILSKLKKRH
jgi:hypothetical protein